jgi:hypothetical protein
MSSEFEPEEGEEVAEPELQRWQFSLRTLLTAVTAFAVFCSLVAWWGWIIVVSVCAYTAGTFIGLVIVSYGGLDFEFTDLRWDITKCFSIGTAIVFLVVGLLWLAPVVHVLLVVPIVMYVVTKLCWLELENPAIVIISLSAIFTTGFAGAVMSAFRQ